MTLTITLADAESDTDLVAVHADLPPGVPPADIQALAQALSDLSCHAAAHAPWLESLEANPVLVRPAGQGLVALDVWLAGYRGFWGARLDALGEHLAAMHGAATDVRPLKNVGRTKRSST